MGSHKYLGIDFSGDHRMWSSGRRKSNVWISVVRSESGKLKLDDLRRVQELAGSDPPFTRLINLLAYRDYRAAGIDAPFSIPHQYVPPGGHRKLLRIFSEDHLLNNRPFPEASVFVNAVAGQPRLNPPKPLRITEDCWKGRGLNVRSTLWAGTRGGAAMTSACLTLLHKAKCPIWPWHEAGKAGLLVEAFPMAQLCHWGLPHEKYNGVNAVRIRKIILSEILTRIDLRKYMDELENSADALDAVLCAFAAIAVDTNKIAVPPAQAPISEGWIAIHS